MERILINYFSELFTTSLPTGLEETCHVVKDNLSSNLREWCALPYTAEDIQNSI